MTFLRTAFVAAGIALAMSFPAFAEEPGASTSPSEAAPPAGDSGKDDLTAEERAEKQARKACKVKICDIPRHQGSARRRCRLRHRQDLARAGHHQDAWRPLQLDLGQGGVPIEARGQARGSGESDARVELRGGLARAESALHACPEVGRRALCRRDLDRTKGRLRERQSCLGKAQLGRSESAHARLCLDLRRHRAR
jgi:hypothetical protein